MTTRRTESSVLEAVEAAAAAKVAAVKIVILNLITVTLSQALRMPAQRMIIAMTSTSLAREMVGAMRSASRERILIAGSL